MGDLIVYRSAHPDVLAAVERYRADYDAWRTRAKDLLRNLGFEDRTWFVTTAIHSWHLVGVTDDGGQEPPSGWRRTVKNDQAVLVPDKRRAYGKHIARQLDECAPPAGPQTRLPGMPGDHLGRGRLFMPGLREMQGAVWVTWGCAVPENEADGPGAAHQATAVDLGVWERVRLSAFYAAIEQQDDEQDGASDE